MLETGSLIDDRYKIIKVLGEGGMAVVYLAKEFGLTQLTVDQNYVQYMIQIGKMTKEEAKNSNKKNVLLNDNRSFRVIFSNRWKFFFDMF